VLIVDMGINADLVHPQIVNKKYGSLPGIFPKGRPWIIKKPAGQSWRHRNGQISRG
jgi:hypothetical protein